MHIRVWIKQMTHIAQTRTFPCYSLATCLGVWICWISPALAQVNGSGPSPSSSFDSVLNLPGDEAIIAGDDFEGIGGVPEQTAQLNVSDGGVVGEGFVVVSGSEVNISGGSVGEGFVAFSNSEVNISRGFVGEGFRAFSSEVNISGGSVGGDFNASRSVVNISGGSLGTVFNASSGSEVNISGGSVGPVFRANTGSDVELIGGEFRLNGANFDGGSISLSSGDVFTGTLADGSAFIFSELSIDNLVDVTLTPVSLPPLDTNPIIVDAPVVDGPSGLRAGQELTVVTGGSLGNNFAVVDAMLNNDAGTLGSGLEAYGSEVNINGGTVGQDFNAFSGSVVNISGGSVGNFFDAFSGSEVNISGGSVGNFFDAFSGSEVNISGGSVGRLFRANSGSVVNISGGSVGETFQALSNSEVNISGGSVGERFEARSDSAVNLFGTEFFLNDVLIDDLNLDQAFVITERDQVLSGTLLDDSDFEFDLNSDFPSFTNPGDFFPTGALLTVTLVEEMFSVDDVCSALAAGSANLALDANGDGLLDLQDLEFTLNQAGSLTGDADGNGTVTFADFLALSNSFGSNDAAYSSGDFNCDGNAAFDDFLILSANFGNSFSAVAAVPEPRSCAWLLMLAFTGASRTRRRS